MPSDSGVTPADAEIRPQSLTLENERGSLSQGASPREGDEPGTRAHSLPTELEQVPAEGSRSHAISAHYLLDHTAQPHLKPVVSFSRRHSSDHFAGIHIPKPGPNGPSKPGPTGPTQLRPTSVDRSRKAGFGSLVRPAPKHKDHAVPLLYNDAAHYIAEEEPQEHSETEGEYDSDVDVIRCELGADDRVLASVAKRGRITVFNVTESFCRPTIDRVMTEIYPNSVHKIYPEVVYLQTPYAARGRYGDVFIFDYGIVACWGLTPGQEQALLQQLQGSCKDKPSIMDEEVMAENFSFHYSKRESPHIQNETITINLRQAQDHLVKLAITHALAQSSKLSVYENRITGLAEEVRYIPEHLAEFGEIQLPRGQVAKLMGRVFLQKSAVNLLSTVLDTPEFFWRMPDSLQVVYESVLDYLALRDRVELINGKFFIIQKILQVWSIHSCHSYLSKLDVIVLWLIFLEVLLTLAQVWVLVVGVAGFHHKQPGALVGPTLTLELSEL